jgi:zinc protease
MSAPTSSRLTHGLTFPGPRDILRQLLPNGITVLARANFNSPSVAVGGYLQSGSIFDTDEKLGLADFTALSLLRGSQVRTFEQTFNALESVGASLSISGGTHTAGFTGHSLVEDLPLVLEILADALRRPVFPAAEIERLRAQLLTGLAMRTQDTTEMASLTFDQLIFAGHPYARPEDGWPETIRAIHRDDLVDFHARCYGPRGMVVTVVGGVEPRLAAEQVAAVLGEWENPFQLEEPALPPLKPLRRTVSRKVKIEAKSQTDLVIGAVGPSRRAPDYLSASLGNSVLGQFGAMGRIGESVREKSGLAYYAFSTLNSGIGPGAWDVSAGVNPGNVERVLDLIRDELSRFSEKRISAEELADSQSNFIGRLPLSMESNYGVTGALLNIERYDLGLDYYQRYPGLIRAVTRDQVLECASKYLHPEILAIAVAGP